MNGQDRLRRRYERLLLLYPREYRAAYGAELVDTLLEASRPGQLRPTAREAVGLLLGGLRTATRQASNGPPPQWLDGLHLGVYLLMLTMLTTAVSTNWAFLDHSTWPWVTVLVMATGATRRGRLAVALPLAFIGAAPVWVPMLYLTVPSLHLVPPSASESVPPYIDPNMIQVSRVGPYLAAVTGLAVLAVARAANQTGGAAPLRHRSWGWFAMPAVAGIVASFGFAYPTDRQWVIAVAAVHVLVLVVAAVKSALVKDLRWAVAATAYLLPSSVWLIVDDGGPMYRLGLPYWLVLAALTSTVAASSLLQRRRIDR